LKGIVFDIKKFAVHDGPGIRTTVFLKGCPLKCQWCQNPESINPKCETIIKINRKKNLNLSYSETKEVFGREVSADEIFDEVKKDMLFYENGGGVTFSGGEPLMQVDFLLELLKKSKSEDFHTAVDTSGMSEFMNFEKILPFTDLFLYDIKIFNDELHKKFTGVSNKTILGNLKKIIAAGANIKVRIPLIPAITDTHENIDRITDFLNNTKKIKQIDILPFNTIYKNKYLKMNLENNLKGLERQSEKKLEEIRKLIVSKGFEVQIGG